VRQSKSLLFICEQAMNAVAGAARHYPEGTSKKNHERVDFAETKNF